MTESDNLLFCLLLHPHRSTVSDRFVHLSWSPHPHHRGLILACSSNCSDDITLVDAIVFFEETEQVRRQRTVRPAELRTSAAVSISLAAATLLLLYSVLSLMLAW